MASPTAARTVARLVLDVLRAHGATTVFGLPGVHNLAFWSAGAAGPAQATAGDAVPLVVRHEQTAVYAADGWARTTGRLGAAVVTTGPGAANAVAAFGEAAASRTPLVLVASQIPAALHRPGRLRGVLHESRDQAAMFRPLAKAVLTPRTPAEVARAVVAAAASALRHPRGPVYVDIPADVLGAVAVAVPPAVATDPSGPGTDLGPGEAADPRRAREAGDSHARAAGAPRPDDLDAAARLLRGRRAVVWAGGGVVDAAEPLVTLAERIGAPVVASYHGRGCPPTAHPLAVGLPPHEPEVATLIGSADVLVAVGGDLDGMNTRNWTMPRPPALVTVDAAPAVDPPEWPADAAVAGDLASALCGLADRLPRGAPWAPAGLRATVLDRLRADVATREAVTLVEAVEAARTSETVLVCDMAVAGYWVGGYAAAPAPRRLAYPVGWGTLGFGLPAAVGAAATGRPVIAVCGDGGLAMALGELATVVQERLPVAVLVVDDAGYGMLRYDQARAGDPPVGTDLVTPDLPAVAAAFGMAATGVATVAELAPALAAAVRTGAPHLVRVPARLTPPRTTSPRWHED